MKDKKLLILGGIALVKDIVLQAQAMGIKAYVTDYLEDSPAKQIADKSFMVSATDVEGISSLIQQENIDGVLTGFVDILLPYYVEICQKNNLPCYATLEQINILSNKDLFKENCRKFNIPVVEEYTLENPLENEAYKDFHYPLLLKPVDNSGGRGITICYSAEEFPDNYAISLSFSKKKKVLIERYMQTKEATIFYYIQNGKPYLTAMGNRHIKYYQKETIPLPVAYSFPAQALTKYEAEIHPRVVQLFEHLNLQDGLLFIQTFVENDNCIFYEIGYRLTGSLEYKIIEKANGFNPLELMIEHAVSGRYSKNLADFSNPHFKQKFCNITFLAKPGIIVEMTPQEEILTLPNVIDIAYAYEKGDEIPSQAKGTLAQVVARTFAYADTTEELRTVMDTIQQNFKVQAIDGTSLLLPTFNVEEL